MDASYQVPLVPQHLRQEENVIQIADVLDHLNNVFCDIMGKINVRIHTNMERTRMIRSRIKTCSDKIDKLVGTNKATRIVCSAKYPAMDCHKHSEAIFKETFCGDIVRTKREMKTKWAASQHNGAQEKLEFYHVKVSGQDPVQGILERAIPRYHDKPPSELTAMGCLLVYGSEDMVYDHTTRGGAGGFSVQAAKEVVEACPASPLHQAPMTVLSRDVHSSTIRGQHLFLYSPNLEEVPTMDMPQDLPHLPGIADDMRFQLDTASIIAPSARAPVTVPDDVTLGKINEGVETPVSSAPVSVREAPPVEAPTPPGNEQTSQAVPPSASTPHAPPPPPPPPPPPSSSQPAEETDSSAHKQSVTTRNTNAPAAPPSSDGRANLMEAIRKAGGSGKARLRSVTAPTTASKKESASKSASGGDLMADLHAKLSMRRKGISGARQQQGVEGSILGALSAMIPPPSVHQDQQSNNSEASSAEDDWE